MPFAVHARADDGDKHSLDVNVLIHHNGVLFSGSDNGEIKAWTENLKLSKTIEAHPSASIFSLAANEDTLYSCSNDGTVKAWDLPSLELKATLLKTESEIWKLWFSDGRLYAGNDEGVISIFENDKLVQCIPIMEPVKDMIVTGKLIFTVMSLDLVISELYGTNPKCGLSVKRTMDGRAPLCIAGDKFCFTSRTGRDIIVRNFSNFKEVAEAQDAHEMIINALCGLGDSAFLYSGGWDKVVKQWKISETSLENVQSCPVDICINAIATGCQGEIYVGGSDGHIVRIDN